MKQIIISLFICSYCIFLPLTSYSQSQSSQDLTNEISSTVMSPYCPGLLLRDCPSEKATALKEQIENKIEAEKLSKEQTISWLESQFGSKIYSSPRMKGFGILGWLAPFLFLAVGGFIVYWWTRKNNSEE